MKTIKRRNGTATENVATTRTQLKMLEERTVALQGELDNAKRKYKKCKSTTKKNLLASSVYQLEGDISLVLAVCNELRTRMAQKELLAEKG